MLRLTTLGCSLLLVLSCKSADEAKPSEKKSEATAPTAEKPAEKLAATDEGKRYDDNLSGDPCGMLTTDMVAIVAKVPADAIKQRAPSGMCLYQWEGGNAGIAFIKLYDNAAEANERFSRAHKSMSADEVKAAMHGASAHMKEKPAVDVAGELTKSMGGGITFEAVEGLGDQAAYDSTRHETNVAHTTIISYGNKLDVRIGNLAFGVSFSLDAVDHKGTMQKDEAIALAKLVLAEL